MSELQQLRDRVAELERALGLDAALSLGDLLRSKDWTRACEPLCGMLLKRELVGREAALIALYGDRPESSQPEIKMLDVLIHRLRKALRPHEITIATAWGRGFYMTAANKQRLEALIDRLRAERQREGVNA